MSDDGSTNDSNGISWETGLFQSRERDLALEDLHPLLASDRRRALLSYLATDLGGTFPVDDLVDVIAESEPPDPGPASHRERIEVDLHHVHLPKLGDAGVLTYDSVTETVQYEGSDRLKYLLAASERAERNED